MNCTDCGNPVTAVNGATRCAACAREDAMYAAYARGVDVPPMWGALEARLRDEALERERPRPARRWRRPLFRTAAAAVAAVSLITFAMMAVRALTFDGGMRRRDEPIASIAATHYRAAIGRLERDAGGDAYALLPRLTSAIVAAERDAASAPDDPLAVTRVVAAYDAKLQLLRASAND